MDPSILLQYWPILLNGFKLTILCWVLGTIFSMALGLIISLAQRYGPRPLGWLIQAYIEVIRGTPFLVQLYVLYYGGPLLGLRLDALPAGLLGLSVYGSPYFAEIFRAGYLSVPVGQIEAVGGDVDLGSQLPVGEVAVAFDQRGGVVIAPAQEQVRDGQLRRGCHLRDGKQT